MPLEWSKAFVPVGGMGEDIDPRLMPVARALSVKNGRFTKRGRVSKRNGFTRLRPDGGGDLTSPLTLGGAWSAMGRVPDARGLLSSGDELCLIGARRLFGWSEVNQTWYDRGQVGPCDTRQRAIFRDSSTYRLCDMAESGGFVVYAGQRSYQSNYEQDTATHHTRTIMATVRTTDGHTVVEPVDLVSGTTKEDDLPHAVRCVGADGYLHVLWLEQTNASPTGAAHELKRRTLDLSDLASGFGSVQTMHSDVFWGGENTRVYDAIPLSHADNAGNWAYAYVTEGTTPDQQVTIAIRSPSGASQQHAVTQAGSLPNNTRVAICEGSAGAITMAMVQDDGSTQNNLLSYQYTAALVYSWGPVTMATLTAGTATDFENIGIAEGHNGSMRRLSYVWAERPSGADRYKLSEKSCDTSGSDLSGASEAYNLNPRSKPFWQGERCYVWANSALAYKATAAAVQGIPAPEEALDAAATEWGSELFEYQCLLDLVVDSVAPKQNTRKPILCGLQNVGTGVVHDADIKTTNMGSLCSVVPFPDGSMRTMAAHWTYLNHGQTRRYAGSELACDFSAAPLAVTLAGGAVMVGGSFVSWYAGVVVEELGFAAPPMLFDSVSGTAYPDNVTLSASTSLADATYRYMATWETYDEKGYLHRSLPCPPTAFTMSSGGGEDAARIYWRTLPASNRIDLPGRSTALVVYRAESDAVAKRITQPTRLELNTDNAYWIDSYDIGQDAGAVLYTDGGVEIENVAPDGARLVARVGDRMWLARANQVQYSKSIASGSATQDAIAPEFNEGFSILTPSGLDVTGLGALDDQLAVFTERECYIVAGRGPNVDGSANDFSGMAYVSSDAGCVEPRSVVAFPAGVLFRSAAGIYLLSRGRQVQFVGAPVEDTLAAHPVITSAVVVPAAQEVRFTANAADGTTGVIIVYQYEEQKWSWWQVTGADGDARAFVGACLHQGAYHCVEATGEVWREDPATWKDDAVSYVPLRVETTWLQAAQQSGWARIKNAIPAADSADPHDLTLEVYSDFEEAESQLHTWSAATIAGLPREALRLRLSRQKCTAIRVAIEDSEASTTDTGEGYTLAGVTLELGIKRGALKVPAGARG